MVRNTISTTVAPVSPRPRLALLDGIRGIAIVLVVLSHGFILWPIDELDQHWWLRPFFRSGNAAVTVFLVASGFLAHRAFTRTGEPADMRPDITFLRRILRVGPALWTMLVVVLIVSVVDSTDPSGTRGTAYESVRVLTYTWNWFAHDNLLDSRPDFGPLWYLSVDMQAFVLMAVLVFALRRRPALLAAALAVIAIALTWWRFHVADSEQLIKLLLRTSVRMDSFVIGVLVGAALHLGRKWYVDPRHAVWAARCTIALLVPAFWYGSDDGRYVEWGSTLLALCVAAAIAAMTRLDGPVVGLGWLTSRPLIWLSERTLLIYVWHTPVFRFVRRHTTTWSWPATATTALLLTAAIVIATDRLVERRVAGWQRSPRWDRLDRRDVGRAAAGQVPAREAPEHP